MKSPIKRPGGKAYLAKWIISLMPPHTHYVEPYLGGGSVLLQKPYEGISEVVNDVDADLMAFWTVLRSPRVFDDFVRIVQATPLSQAMFNKAKQAQGTTGRTALQMAVDFFIVARQSRQGLGKDFATLSKTRTRRGMNEQVSAWLTAVDGLADVHRRLQRVVFLDSDALKVIRAEDTPQTHFLCDPPYLFETRTDVKQYTHEMTNEQHEQLLQTLAKIEGTFQLCAYDSPLYRRYAEQHGWSVSTQLIDNKASSQKIKPIKTECLFMNYDPAAVAG